jgi:hypothetical protein
MTSMWPYVTWTVFYVFGHWVSNDCDPRLRLVACCWLAWHFLIGLLFLTFLATYMLIWVLSIPLVLFTVVIDRRGILSFIFANLQPRPILIFNAIAIWFYIGTFGFGIDRVSLTVRDCFSSVSNWITAKRFSRSASRLLTLALNWSHKRHSFSTRSFEFIQDWNLFSSTVVFNHSSVINLPLCSHPRTS